MTRAVFSSGSTENLEFTVTYSSDWSDGDLAGTNVAAAAISSARFLLKRNIEDTDANAVLTKTNADGITLADGLVTVALSASDTSTLSGVYYATLRLYLATGSVQDWRDSDSIPYIEVNVTRGAVKATS